MCKRPNLKLHQRRQTNGKETCEEMLHIVCHRADGNENKEAPAHTHVLELSKPTALTVSNAGEGVEQQEVSFIASANAKRYSHLGGHLVVS